MSRIGCNWGELLAFLKEQGLVNAEGAAIIQNRLGRDEGRMAEPLVLKLFAGIGGWFSAIFLLFFMGVSRLISFDSVFSLMAWGICLSVGAVLLSRQKGGLFQRQLGLAIGAAGFALVLIGAGIRTDTLGGVVLAAFLLTGSLYPFNRDDVYRFLAVGTTLVVTVIWGIYDLKEPGFIHGLIALQAGTLAVLWRHGPAFRRMLPLVYALVITLSFSLTIGFYPDDLLALPLISWWPSQLFLSLWLAFLLVSVWRNSSGRQGGVLGALLLTTTILGVVSTPGILASFGIILMAQSRLDRWLSLLGLIGFAVFIFFFYYLMALPLDQKSYLLMGSGALLLAVRYLLARVESAPGGDA